MNALDEQKPFWEKKPPVWFYVISVIALLWNIMGVSVFFSDVTKTAEDIALLDPKMQPFYEDVPLWNWLAFGLATIAGFLGSVCLLIKKKWAYSLFTLSLIGILVQNFWSFVVDDAMEALGSKAFIMPTLVIGIGIGLLFLSKNAKERGWLT